MTTSASLLARGIYRRAAQTVPPCLRHRVASAAVAAKSRDAGYLENSDTISDASQNLASTSDDLATSKKPKAKAGPERIVTRKSFAALPTAYIRTDGTPAPPLDSWRGAADSDRPIMPASSRFDTEAFLVPKQEDAHDENLPDGRTRKAEATRVRRRRTRAGQSDDMCLPESGDATSGDITSVKPKRRRKSELVNDTPASTSKGRKKKSTEGVSEPADGGSKRKRVSAEKGTISRPEPPRGQLATEVLDNLRKFPHCILLTRVGQFYESYFAQAPEVARLLNIKLASRRWGGGRVHMCGFPLAHLDRHLKTLVQTHRRFVAMCEEFPRRAQTHRDNSIKEHNFSSAKEFDRRVVRVITPGTLIDESFLNPYENNYLLAIAPRDLFDKPKESLPAQVSPQQRKVPRDVNLPPATDPAVGPLDTMATDLSPAAGEEAVVGLAWIDVSTGEFISKVSALECLRDDLARINPREIVLDERLKVIPDHPVFGALREEDYLISYINTTLATETTARSVDSHDSDSTGPSDEQTDRVTSFAASDDITASDDTKLAFEAQEATAFNLITAYLSANFLERPPTLALPAREGSSGRMQIDAHTITALEIRERMRDGGTHGSLLSAIRRTVTNSGTRLLGRWLCSPSTSIPEIRARQALVAFFHARPHFRDDLVLLLKSVDDAGRIVQKFLVGRGEPSDLGAIRATINIWSAVRGSIHAEKALEMTERSNFNEAEWAAIDALAGRMADLEPLASRISMALEGVETDVKKEIDEEDSEADDGDVQNSMFASVDPRPEKPAWKFGTNSWSIKPEFSGTLTSLHKALTVLLSRREEMELEFQRRYNAPSLTLRSSPGQGMHVHLSKVRRDQKGLNESNDFISIAESGSTKSYFNLEWSRLGSQIIETTIALEFAEREALEALRNEVNAHTAQLRRNARIIDELDVTLAFANLANEMNLVRPEITEDNTYFVENGRHPAVELGLLNSGRIFTPNTVTMTPSSHLHIITGPNMAGKSTLLRQTALIAILAQAGSFVPADAARISIVDRLFSRVGAKDDLFHDRSTFMVEMLETAEILRRATSKSLVIMDEVGRGTTVKDGLAIAFSTVHHLATVNKCRTLFATHFHELSDMLGCDYPATPLPQGQGSFKHVSFYCSGVDETDDGHFSYSYRLHPGVNRDSHGLKVAQLAGMPPSAISIAQLALAHMKARNEDSIHDDLKKLGHELTNLVLN